MLSSRRNPYPPHRRSLEISRGRGVLKAKFLEAMYENACKLEFIEGRGEDGAKQKKPSVGGVRIFSGTAYLIKHHLDPFSVRPFKCSITKLVMWDTKLACVFM